MAEMETRELEYFVAVAEELHFVRAAARLRIAQPALSRAIQRLEARLGVVLLERDSRHVALTPAGDALLYHARQVLTAIARASASARSVRARAATVRLVVKPGGDHDLVPEIVRTFERRRGAPQVDIVFGGLADRVEHLRDGRADLAIVYDPLDDVSGLDYRELMSEGKVAVVPSDHRLAGRDHVVMAELANETMAHWKGLSHGAAGPEVSSMSEFALVVALGRGLAVLPPSTVTMLSDHAVCVPISDAVPTRTLIAWDETKSTPYVVAFADEAQRVARSRRETASA